MTIAAAYLTSEGVVLGADSTTTLTVAGQPQQAVQLLNHAQKLFEIGRPGTGRIAVVTWGTATVGATSHRTIAARVGERVTDATTVREVVDLFINEVRSAIGEGDPGFGYMIGGWNPGSHIPECYEVVFGRAPVPAAAPIPPGGGPVAQPPTAQPPVPVPGGSPSGPAPDLGRPVPPSAAPGSGGVQGPPAPGVAPPASPIPAPVPPPPAQVLASIDPFQIGQARFRGIPVMFLRAYWGYDPEFMTAVWDFLKATIGHVVPHPQLDQLLLPAIEHAKMGILRAGHSDLPIREAIDFVYMYVHLTIKSFKFRIGPPPCGGPIEIGFITTDRLFRWVRHKPFDSAIDETGVT